jgi:hypothetical protein
MVSPVTDPALLAQLNSSGPTPVTDPSLLAFLEGGKQPAKKSFLSSVKETAEGVLEPAVSVGTGLVSALASTPAVAGGALYELLSGNAGKGYNTPQKIFEGFVQQGTYQPRSEAGRENLAALGRAFQESKIPVAPQITGGLASAVAPQLMRAVPSQIMGEMTARSATKQAAALKESRLAAPKIEAVQTAQASNYVLPPTAVKEGGMRSAFETLAGRENVVNHASLANQPITNAKARRVLGLSEDTPLTREAFDEVTKRTNAPYEAISQVPAMGVDDAFRQDLMRINNLDGLSPEVQAIVRKSAEAEKLMAQLAGLETVSGKEAVALINDLRTKANAVGMEASAAEKAMQSVQKSAARSLESLLDRNLASMAETNPSYAGLLKEFQDARRTKAQMHMIRKATNLETGNVNAVEIGRRAGKGDLVTGELKDIADVAAAFPQAFRTPEQVGPTSRTMTALTGGLFGAAGATIGGPLGAVVGPLAWQLARTQARKTALSPKMQRSLAMDDARSMRERMGYQQPQQSVQQTGPFVGPPRAPEGWQPPLPMLPEAPPLVPGSWRGALVPEQPNAPLPALPQQLLPLSEQYSGTGMPIGLIEGGGPATANTPLPKLPPQTRGLLDIGETPSAVPDTRRLATRHDVPTMEFPLRQEVLQQPEIRGAIEAFTKEAERLRGLTQSAGGFWKERYAAELTKLEDEFAAGMKQLGIRSREEALGLVKLYESGGTPRLQIERTRGLLD